MTLSCEIHTTLNPKWIISNSYNRVNQYDMVKSVIFLIVAQSYEPPSIFITRQSSSIWFQCTNRVRIRPYWANSQTTHILNKSTLISPFLKILYLDHYFIPFIFTNISHTSCITFTIHFQTHINFYFKLIYHSLYDPWNIILYKPSFQSHN